MTTNAIDISICEAVSPIYNCTDMNGLVQEIGGDLNSIFSFGISALKTLYLGDTEHESEYRRLLENANKSRIEAGEFDIEEYMEEVKSIEGVCETFRKSGQGVDYAIVISEPLNPSLPFILGEEITHGEHITAHTNTSGSYRYFFKRFTPTVEEFIAYTGRIYVERMLMPHYVRFLERHGVEFEPSGGDQTRIRNGVLEINMPHIIGYQVAKQFFDKGKGKYRDIFHAPNEREVWGIVNSELIPEIRVNIPSPYEADRKNLQKLFESVSRRGLKAEIEIVCDDRLVAAIEESRVNDD